ncbi:MAG: metallophosphoesterase family protein [Kofleriaceae bacterium]
MSEPPLRLAVLGDVHGHLTLAFRVGRVYTFTRGERSVRIGALGGISERGKPGRDPVSEYYVAHDVRALKQARHDILLSHEPPLGAATTLHPKYADGGSPDCAEVLRAQRPRLHFCGHYHEPGALLDSPAGVRSYQLNAVNFLRADRLNPGCIAIVAWNDADDAQVELLDPTWLREYTRHSWRHR